jgi:ABC-type phosphonate transport system ATPase subunit
MGILGERIGRMENEIRRHFNKIIDDAKAVLESVEIEQDYSVKRALLKLYYCAFFA